MIEQSRKILTQEELKNIVEYIPETGEFFYIAKSRKGKRADKLHESTGYHRFQIKGKRYLAHVLAWLYVYGEFPGTQIDHKNTIKSDNRIGNLRLSSYVTNPLNMNLYSTNKTGVKGVSFYRGKYVARITYNKICYQLGTYSTLEEAKSVVDRAREDLHKEFANYG